MFFLHHHCLPFSDKMYFISCFIQFVLFIFLLVNPYRKWAIPDKNRTAPRMTNRLSAVVSFDTGNIQGNLLIVQGNLFRCHPWGCTIFIWSSPIHTRTTIRFVRHKNPAVVMSYQHNFNAFVQILCES